MRTRIDLTDEAEPGAFTVADPGELETEEGPGLDDVTITVRLREVELVLTYPQLVALTDAFNAHRFRAHGRRGVTDLNEDLFDDFEHEQLRRLVTDLTDGLLDGLEVPLKIANGVQERVRRTRSSIAEARRRAPDDPTGEAMGWRWMRDQLLAAEEKIVMLQAEVAVLNRRRKRSP